MSARVTVADYGIGNLLSVRRALEHCGAEVEMATSSADVRRAERLVLPGVGAFAGCMRALRERGLVESLQSFASSGRPFLGICVGLQMMFEVGEEHGEHAGLGLLPGRVVAIPAAPGRKIPHIGWSALQSSGRDWNGTILEGSAPAATAVYFVHSYHVRAAADSDALAITDYGGYKITAAVSRGNLHGCQFHPEKSGRDGLQVLRNFLAAS